MAGYVGIIKKETKIHLQSIGDDIKARRNPDFFWPTGTQVYVGRQGSGKTISAVKHVHRLKERYPKAVIVSNIAFNTFEPVLVKTENIENQVEYLDKENQYLLFSSMDELAVVLTKVNNGFFGVIYVVDEIHTYFNALDSKNVPMFVFTEISQQRKQRKLIIGTSQLFLRMAKPLREQCDNLIVCKTRFGVLTTQKAYDGMTLEQDYDGKMTGDVKKTGWFWHTRALRNSFDTYQKVVSAAEQFEYEQRVQIFEKKKGLSLKR